MTGTKHVRTHVCTCVYVCVDGAPYQSGAVIMGGRQGCDRISVMTSVHVWDLGDGIATLGPTTY